MTTLTWLHLSDLHLSGTETAVERRIFESMLDDIRVHRAEKGIHPDLVFFTGDIAGSGQKEQYAQAGSWLDEILDACGLSGQRQQLFIVPGNHDVNRIAVRQPAFVYKQYVDFARALLDSDKCDEIDKFLEDDEHKKWAFKKFDDFARFVDDFFADGEIKFSASRYYSVRLVKKEKYEICVMGLNSAWLSFEDNEQGRLLLGENQVINALKEGDKKCPNAHLRIALMHHPLYWLAEKDIHKVEQHLRGGCDLMLRGHLHCPSFSIQSTPDSHLLEFAAGASLKAPFRAYNFVQLDLDTGEGVAMVRLQQPGISLNWTDDTFTYRNSKDGRIAFSLARLKNTETTEA